MADTAKTEPGSTTANPTHTGGPDAGDTGVRPHDADTTRAAGDSDDTDGKDGVLVFAPPFHVIEVRNLTIHDTGTRVPRSRLAEVRNTAEKLGLALYEPDE